MPTDTYTFALSDADIAALAACGCVTTHSVTLTPGSPSWTCPAGGVIGGVVNDPTAIGAGGGGGATDGGGLTFGAGGGQSGGCAVRATIGVTGGTTYTAVFDGGVDAKFYGDSSTGGTGVWAEGGENGGDGGAGVGGAGGSAAGAILDGDPDLSTPGQVGADGSSIVGGDGGNCVCGGAGGHGGDVGGSPYPFPDGGDGADPGGGGGGALAFDAPHSGGAGGGPRVTFTYQTCG